MYFFVVWIESGPQRVDYLSGTALVALLIDSFVFLHPRQKCEAWRQFSRLWNKHGDRCTCDRKFSSKNESVPNIWKSWKFDIHVLHPQIYIYIYQWQFLHKLLMFIIYNLYTWYLPAVPKRSEWGMIEKKTLGILMHHRPNQTKFGDLNMYCSNFHTCFAKQKFNDSMDTFLLHHYSIALALRIHTPP